MHWHISNRFDARALPLADRHYNRQTPGSPQFVPPGRCLVLLTEHADALWVTSWPLEEYTKHEWAGAWVNSLFRNESSHLSSTLIREAVAATRHHWPSVPDLGLVTFVDADEVESRNPGYCYECAGFERVGYTKINRLHVWQLTEGCMPDPQPARGDNYTLL